MTKIRSAMFALAIAAGAAATAGAQQVTTPQAGQRIEHAQRDSAKWGRREGRGERHMGARALLRGVKLTDAQKAQVKAINQKYRPQFEALKQQNKPAMDEARAARQRGDTAAARAAFARTAGTREQAQSLRQQELNEVRGVLTADQQKTFDANLQQVKTRMEQRGQRGHGRAHSAK